VFVRGSEHRELPLAAELSDEPAEISGGGERAEKSQHVLEFFLELPRGPVAPLALTIQRLHERHLELRGNGRVAA
jgi:hypothetical protein